MAWHCLVVRPGPGWARRCPSREARRLCCCEEMATWPVPSPSQIEFPVCMAAESEGRQCLTFNEVSVSPCQLSDGGRYQVNVR